MNKPRRLLLLLLCLALCGCGSGSDEPVQTQSSPDDQARADQFFAAYESARNGENWEVAEAQADQLREKYPDSSAAAKLASNIARVREQAEASREARRQQELWQYQAIAVGKGEQRSASIFSRTVAAGEGELVPQADAQLVLRDHPAWGSSAYLLLAQSQFKCGKPCVMQIRFDDAPGRRWSGKQADSGKGPALFIEDDADFIEAMSQAKLVRIELPKDSGRIPGLAFEVAGYQPGRYAKP